jgi:hypothetical protein
MSAMSSLAGNQAVEPVRRLTPAPPLAFTHVRVFDSPTNSHRCRRAQVRAVGRAIREGVVPKNVGFAV